MKSTVLLIDDDPVDIKPVQALLESWDIDVVAVRSGQEGIDHLKSISVDAVVSDVRMPEMSGEEVVQAIGKAHPGLPVVLITGHGDVKSAVNAMRLGAFDYVIKPPDSDEFKLTLERALEHSLLWRENQFLRAELGAGGMYGERLIGKSPKMLAVFDLINRVARTDSIVLITGETGTGKELVAQTIHYKSSRASRPLIAMNCASFNPNLIESELFGHEKGAFTGAHAVRRGRFEDADGGTLFLDEIGETSLDFQAKLLRVLQEGEFERLGGNKKIKVDTRVLVSTNRDLQERVKSGDFREDLFYRLSVIPIHLPPLRERHEDIVILANYFVAMYAKRYSCPAKIISKSGLEYLKSQEWKGNVRELQHTIERAVVLSRKKELAIDDFKVPAALEQAAETSLTLESFLDGKTRDYLVEILDKTNWRKGKAADLLGVDRATLYRLLKKYSVDRNEH
jgi:DNA-binding NtrC family response regulator